MSEQPQSPRPSGGDADRLDPAGPGTGGMPTDGAGPSDDGDLEQSAALGPTDDPEGGSIQQHGNA